MLLAIDAGNTNILFALFDDKELKIFWRCSTNAARTMDEYGVWLRQLMEFENIDPADITGAILASVVPVANAQLKGMCKKYFKLDPLVVGEPNIEPGIDIHIDNPKELGADRLVNAVAGGSLYGGPLVIVDFGTATTFDVVDEAGGYHGGAISPGINLSLDALHRAAAKLPRLDVAKPNKVIGSNTIEAMRSGVFWGYAGLIEGMLGRISREFGQDMKTVATGGLAPLFCKSLDCLDHHDDTLTLTGLRLIYERNLSA